MTYVRKEIIGSCTLYLGDSLLIMPTLDFVDCVVTDPPYLLESGGNTTGEMGGKFAVGTYDNSGSIVDTPVDWPDFMPLVADLLPQGHAYFMCNNRHVARAQNAAESAGFRFHNLLVWHKSTITPNRWYMKNLEFTLFMFRGKAMPIRDKGKSQLMRCQTPSGGLHPTEKPVGLMAEYIQASAKPGDTVLDCFMGTGATALAAMGAGCKFVGIEKNEAYFNESCRRIAAKQSNFGDLFEVK